MMRSIVEQFVRITKRIPVRVLVEFGRDRNYGDSLPNARFLKSADACVHGSRSLMPRAPLVVVNPSFPESIGPHVDVLPGRVLVSALLMLPQATPQIRDLLRR
jgi:hypothetical protein